MSGPLRVVGELNDTEQAFVTEYAEAKTRLPGAERDWVGALRTGGMDVFRTAGLPHRRVEEWKYTDLRGRLQDSLPPMAPADGAVLREGFGTDPFEAFAGPAMVFVNGFWREDLSSLGELPDGVSVEPLSQALKRDGADLEALFDHPLPERPQATHGLNLALMRDGAVLRVADGTVVEAPIRLVFLTTEAGAGQAAHTHNLIAVGSGAKATLLESHVGAPGARLATIGAHIHVAENGVLNHIKVQNDTRDAIHVASHFVRLAGHARYEGFALTAGGRLTRNESFVRFDGPEAFARTDGVTLMIDAQHADNTVVIDHAVPDCESHQLFKNVLADQARGVFQGKIIVRQDAQRTDGYQLSQGLLLSPRAEADTKPELEIYADDVKCSHGATIGALDSESIFYLRSRGLPEGDAKALLVEAFVGEALDEVPEEAVREALRAAVAGWLAVNRDRVVAAAAAGDWDHAGGEEIQ